MIKTVVFGGEHNDFLRDLQDSAEVFYAYCKTFPVHYRKNGNGKYLSQKFLSYAPDWIIKKCYKRIFGWSFLNEIKNNDDVLFICFSSFALIGDYIFLEFIKSIKKIYPNSKFAFYYNETINRLTSDFIKINELKNEFDIILTFDEKDSIKYDITYYGDINSKVPENILKKAEPCDIFYCGGGNSRFKTQIQVFKKTSDMMLKDIFYIAGLSDKEILSLPSLLDGIQSIGNNAWKYKNSFLYTNKYLRYETVVSYNISSKCILEVLLKEQQGSTLRHSESHIYRKKLLTNNQNVSRHPAYSKNNIMVFDNPDDIDKNAFVDFINSPYEKIDYDFSPLKMVEYIKEKLFKEV